MYITGKNLLEILPRNEITASGMTVGAVLALLKRHYCMKKTVAGTCPQVCSQCKVNIKSALNFRAIENPEKPAGIFVWRLRNIVAQEAEQRKKEVPGENKDEFGIKKEVDIWDMAESVL